MLLSFLMYDTGLIQYTNQVFRQQISSFDFGNVSLQFPLTAGDCTSESELFGVHKKGERWHVTVCPIGKPNIHLGCFDSATDAAIVYDAEVLKLNLKEKKPLNFEWRSAVEASARADAVRARENTRATEAQQAVLRSKISF